MAGTDDPDILPCARKNGIADKDLLHAYRNATAFWDLEDPGWMIVGAARDGTLLEVGVAQGFDHPERLVIFHGMKARKKFLPPTKTKRRR